MDLDAYLSRIGAKRPEKPSAKALRELHERHLERVPFENLSVHLPEPIELTEDALFDKIVRRRRGGFCYELNGAFAALLRGLGFEVKLLSARIFHNGRPGPPLVHVVLRVDLKEPWLVDVGFGRRSMHHPLRMVVCEPQLDPGGEFSVLGTPDGDWDMLQGGEPIYRVERRAHELSDFVPTCWWQATSPDSHFTSGLLCSRVTPTGRITIAGDRLIETANGKRTERVLADNEIVSTYRTVFDIELESAPVPGHFPAPGHSSFPN